ncbi:MFS transporter [Dactylosporangium aurantiacum]|uniref:MFS transporter n=1 Tax=Dactylosporangium aurantiacum TaxID=35754 RepID=A0A9Q9IKX0_9ACTN|nr:MFS transporter [Dactylosporangium aurantiacum]MDG6105778.1 MFS transporter [Dactylosporangium aurantiacum]UWZ58034.1 MFS transporter [Dactylosporangium aurantiacum]
MSAAAVDAAPSTWSPLRNGVFRVLWLAVLGSQVGTWMQTVGAQWLLVDRPDAAALVSLVQTAGTLPVVLLALPAGVLADSLDRRRLLIWVQLFQLAVGVLLTGLTVAGQTTPALLLTLTFALGCGMAMTSPTYQAVIPELVPRHEIRAAAALGSISVNLARAVGPALAGVLVAHVGVAAVFGINAVTFLVFAVVLVLWRRQPPQDAPLPEPFLAAMRAGGRYVRHSRAVRRFLLRIGVFILPAVSLWALLPLVSSRQLGMGAGGYGLLLAALGAGAVLGAMVLPRLRAGLSDNWLLAAASVTYALVLTLLALVREPVVAALALVPAGFCWMAVLSNANAELQLFLPRWVRARGLGTYQSVFFGGQAVGAFAWGLLANRAGLVPALLAAAAVTVAGAATVPLWPLIDTRHLNRDPATPWPQPRLTVEPDRFAGPVVVEVTYTIAAEDEPAFLAMADALRRTRMRTGAVQWGVFRAGEFPDRMVEVYVVPSWDEHLRQHSGRMTGADEELDRRVAALSAPPPTVVHLLPAR